MSKNVGKGLAFSAFYCTFANNQNLLDMEQNNDKVQLAAKGITPEQLASQLNAFKTGFPFLELEGAASIENGGIFSPTPTAIEAFIKAWEVYAADADHRVVKFVPASGAASRMFKDLFAFLEGDHDEPTTAFERTFFERLGDAAFYRALDEVLTRSVGKDIPTLLAEKQYKTVVKYLLSSEGLNYGNLPKGLLLFHKAADGARTPFEEHLVEGAAYAKNGEAQVSVHFTVSPEHRPLFEALAAEKIPHYEQQLAAKYEVSFSEQKASTDTVAANADGSAFRNADGSLLFRPGGHGALIENLNDIDADVVFIKNIDNVVPDRLKTDTIRYKQLLAGVLVSLQARAFAYLEQLDEGNLSESQLAEILAFVETDLHCHSDAAQALEGLELMDYLYCKLNRPMRVCGMVRNVGEPGGGPFLAYNPDGTVSLQILESSQIDMADANKKAMFEQGTHFNPVDLVCATKDYEGERFDLREFVDPATGFISHKSKDGKPLQALELPGLWNGAMSDWNTIFVEVPLSTFNPVKTVNDLFREQHQ